MYVTSCPACALPNIEQNTTCSFCGEQLLIHAPLLTRITRQGDSFALTTAERVLGTAERVGELWSISTGSTAPLTLLTVNDEDGEEIALVDSRLNVAATVRSMPNGTSTQTLLITDAEDRLRAAVRADGCGGIHAVTPEGNVLMFAGRNRSDAGDVVDMLLTDAGCNVPLVVLFALGVTLQVASFGPLRHKTTPAPPVN